jgi:hypothetical protein
MKRVHYVATTRSTRVTYYLKVEVPPDIPEEEVEQYVLDREQDTEGEYIGHSLGNDVEGVVEIKIVDKPHEPFFPLHDHALGGTSMTPYEHIIALYRTMPGAPMPAKDRGYHSWGKVEGNDHWLFCEAIVRLVFATRNKEKFK